MNKRGYANRIYRNRYTITALQSDEFPALHRFLHERGGVWLDRLLFLLEMAESFENQEGYSYGYWLIMPYTRLAAEGAAVARSDATWKKTIILFTAMGLIERKIPTTATAATPYEKRVVAYAVEHGYRHAAEFLTIPQYSNHQLHYIERKAAIWYRKNGTLEGLCKAKIIDIFGTATADRVYGDRRRKPHYKAEAEAQIITTIKDLLSRQPYTGRAEVLQEAATAWAAGQPEEERDRLLRIYKRLWDSSGKRLLQEAGATSRQPTAEQRAEYDLFTRTHIITKKEGSKSVE